MEFNSCFWSFRKTLHRAALLITVLAIAIALKGKLSVSTPSQVSRVHRQECERVPTHISDPVLLELEIPTLPTVSALGAWLKPEQGKLASSL